jgi:hypothetical protein
VREHQLRHFKLGGEHGTLGVVLVGLGIPKLNKDAIAHILRYEAAETLYGTWRCFAPSILSSLMAKTFVSRRSSIENALWQNCYRLRA